MTDELREALERVRKFEQGPPFDDDLDWSAEADIIVAAFLADHAPEREAERREITDFLLAEQDDYGSVNLTEVEVRRLIDLLTEPTK